MVASIPQIESALNLFRNIIVILFPNILTLQQPPATLYFHRKLEKAIRECGKYQ
jgi:hypothetical protein